MCGYKFNKDHAVKCKTCRYKAPVTQFSVKVNGNHYLTAVYSARPPQKVELMRAFNPLMGTSIEAVLDGTGDVPLQSRIIRTFIREIGATQEIRDEIVDKCSIVLRVDYPLPPEIAEEHESAEILAEKIAHFDYSDASAEEDEVGSVVDVDSVASTSEMVDRDLDALDESGAFVGIVTGGESEIMSQVGFNESGLPRSAGSAGKLIGSRTNTAASFASIMTEEDSMDSVHPNSHHKRHRHRHHHHHQKKKRKKKDRGKLDLFEQVMENGKGLVYDPSIGQFSDRKGITRRKSLSPEQIKNLHGVNDHFNYVKFMKREKDAMTMKMGFLLKEAEEKAHHHGHSGNLTNEEMAKKIMSQGSVLESSLIKKCALCEVERAPWNLPGRVPFKAVADWRRGRGAAFPKNDRRLAQSRMYEPVQLCLFCTQFFTADFSDYVEYHLGSTGIKDKALEVEDTSGRKNELNPDITRSLQDYSERKVVKQDFIRPSSAFLQEMELDALRDKKYLPKLMSNMGVSLARAVLPENAPKQLFVPTTQHGGLGSSLRRKKRANGRSGMSKSGPLKLKSLWHGGKNVSRRELLVGQLQESQEALSPLSKSANLRNAFENSEKNLRQSGINLAVKPNLKRGGRKKRKKGNSSQPANTHSKLEAILADDDEPETQRENVRPNNNRRAGRGEGGRRREKPPPQVSAYKQSMKKASSVYV